jgi:transcription-repair coupling factor (superfamily II helicase)
VETVVEADLDALIPEAYVENTSERLAVYRKLYGVASREQLEEVGTELRDRFGPHPPEVENLFALILLKLAAQKIGFVKVSVTGVTMEADFPPESDTGFYGSELFQSLMTGISGMRAAGVALKQTGKTLKLTARLRPGEELTHARSCLETLHPPAAAVTA